MNFNTQNEERSSIRNCTYNFTCVFFYTLCACVRAVHVCVPTRMRVCGVCAYMHAFLCVHACVHVCECACMRACVLTCTNDFNNFTTSVKTECVHFINTILLL